MRKRTSGIYIIKHKKSGKVYVGQSNYLARRFTDHKRYLNQGTHFSPRLQNAWNKYGARAFVFIVVEVVPPKKRLLKQREQYWIDYYKAFNDQYGYNIAPAAQSLLGYKWTDESRKKLSLSCKGRKVSLETRKKLSRIHKKIKHTKKWDKNISLGHMGIIRGPMSQEHKDKIAKSMTGKKQSKATKLKKSKAHKGKPKSIKHLQSLIIARNKPEYKAQLETRRDPKTGRLLPKNKP